LLTIKTPPIDLMYIEGNGGIVDALSTWHAKEDVMSETSLTFSSQVFDFCKANNFTTLAVSAYKSSAQIHLDNFYAFSEPKLQLSGSLGYYLSQFLYAIKIMYWALKFKPTYLHITSGATFWFLLAPLKLLGIKIFPQLHNTLWAKGFMPKSYIKVLFLTLDAWFFKHIASGVICCSPEVKRQVEAITANKSCPIYVFKPQFNPSKFVISQKTTYNQSDDFNVVFAGRIERDKGVFDLLAMAKTLQHENVKFHICGDGSSLNALRELCETQNLSQSFKIYGRLKQDKLIEIYSKSHVVIVPTTKDFAEGLAMVAVEAILLDKPVIASSVVPALELIKSASIEVESESIEGYINAIRSLKNDQHFYQQLCSSCNALKMQFIDKKSGLSNVMQQTLIG
jgi:glycogen synthase